MIRVCEKDVFAMRRMRVSQSTGRALLMTALNSASKRHSGKVLKTLRTGDSLKKILAEIADIK